MCEQWDRSYTTSYMFGSLGWLVWPDSGEHFYGWAFEERLTGLIPRNPQHAAIKNYVDYIVTLERGVRGRKGKASCMRISGVMRGGQPAWIEATPTVSL